MTSYTEYVALADVSCVKSDCDVKDRLYQRDIIIACQNMQNKLFFM